MTYKFMLAAILALSWATVGHADESNMAVESSSASQSLLTAEVQIGTELESNDPANVQDEYGTNVAQLVGWSKISGAAEPTTIHHVWTLNGEQVADVVLEVKSSSFRTWSRKSTYGLAGIWKLDVQDNSGNSLGSDEVELKEMSKESETSETPNEEK